MRVWAALSILLAACGGSAAAGPSEPSRPPAQEHARLAPPARPWTELSFDDRKGHMSRAVLPAMTELFQGYDAGRYQGFFCDTCHGPDARERNFAMPNPHLPPLYPTGSEEQHQTVRDHPEMVRFMFNRVVPAMQELLGAEPFDQATGSGFTCFACHPAGEPARGVDG